MAYKEKFENFAEEEKEERLEISVLNKINDDIMSNPSRIESVFDEKSGKIIGHKIFDKDGRIVLFELESANPKFDQVDKKSRKERVFENKKIQEMIDRMMEIGAVEMSIDWDKKTGEVTEETLKDIKGDIIYFDNKKFGDHKDKI